MQIANRKPDWQNSVHNISLYRGDCTKLLPTMSGRVSAVITDPPYGVNCEWWDDSVPHFLLKEFLRLSEGVVVWFGAAAQHRNDLVAFDPPPDRVCIWAPKFTLSKTMANGMAYRWHPVYLWNPPKKHTGPTWDVFNEKTDGRNWWKHPATKPLKLMQSLCGMCIGDVILDPFLGSGSTGVAAVLSGKGFVGFEIEEKYFDVSVQRIQNAIKKKESGFGISPKNKPAAGFGFKPRRKPRKKKSK